MSWDVMHWMPLSKTRTAKLQESHEPWLLGWGFPVSEERLDTTTYDIDESLDEKNLP
jgi:hypothetical protein